MSVGVDIKEETEETIVVLVDELRVILGQIEATLYVDIPKIKATTEGPITIVDRIHVSLNDCRSLADRIFVQTTRIS